MDVSPRGRLAGLRGADLQRLHAEGTAPDPESLFGPIDGAVLTGSLSVPGVRALGTWRGKVFDREQDVVGGLNRLGLGPLELRRFRFRTHVGRSVFTNRDVILLDHDLPGNPHPVRRFHDELVEVEAGLYLATSHYRLRDSLGFLAYFALAAD